MMSHHKTVPFTVPSPSSSAASAPPRRSVAAAAAAVPASASHARRRATRRSQPATMGEPQSDVSKPFTSGIKSMETTHKPLLVLRSKVVVVGDAHVGKSALVQARISVTCCVAPPYPREPRLRAPPFFLIRRGGSGPSLSSRRRRSAHGLSRARRKNTRAPCTHALARMVADVVGRRDGSSPLSPSAALRAPHARLVASQQRRRGRRRSSVECARSLSAPSTRCPPSSFNRNKLLLVARVVSGASSSNTN